jgi:hypothetical protein
VTQLGLEWNRANAPELQRVTGRIGLEVLAFCRSQPNGSTFHMAALTRFVVEETGVAPASPDRVLRALRQLGHLDYEIVNRRQSLYRILRVS